MKLTIWLDDKPILNKEIPEWNGSKTQNPVSLSQKMKVPKAKIGVKKEFGLAGELAIASMLRLLNVNYIKLPNHLFADFLLTKSGKLLEVKTAHKGYSTVNIKGTKRKSECYAFNVKQKIADYFVVWAVDISKFYVFPVEDVKPGVNRIYPHCQRWKYREEHWKILG